MGNPVKKIESSAEAIITAVEKYAVEAKNFWENENKSAGARARKLLMEIKQLAHGERAAITEKVNSLKGK
jgi:hypothetical protein